MSGSGIVADATRGRTDVGVATAFPAHDAARLMTGDTISVDAGYHIVDGHVRRARPVA